MKKLTLDLDEIQVVSFEAETVARDRGTVGAHSAATPILACGASLMSCNSCFPDVCPPEKLTTENVQECFGG